MMTSCTSTRHASQEAEYDDVYYSPSTDAVEVVASRTDDPTLNRQDEDGNYVYNADRFRRPVDSYYDEYYQDDDFYFSRRMRRFDQRGSASWRYYDPFFMNDLYFVMGTPTWNRWNSMGWYNWNYPRFGATWGWNTPMNAGFGFGYGDPFWGNNWNRWNNFNYYSPWMNAYYGYDPFFAPGWGNPYAVGFGNGWNAGFVNGYYCPPVGAGTFFNNGLSGARTAQRLQSYRRPTSGGSAAQTSYTGARPAANRDPAVTSVNTGSPQGARPVEDATSRDANRNSRYLQPRTASERVERNLPATYTRPGTTTPSTRTERMTPDSRARTSTTPRTTTTERSTTTREPRVYTRPSRPYTVSPSQERARTNTMPFRNRTYTQPRRTYTPSSSERSRPSYQPSRTPSRSTPSYRPSGSSGSRSSGRSSSSSSSGSRPSSSGSRRP